MKFCSCCLLLELTFFNGSLSGKLFKLLPDFFILSLDMLKIAFSCIEVMFVLSAIITSVVFLYYFGLLHKELALLVLHFILFLIYKLATANISSPDSLDSNWSSAFVIMLPLDFEHSPIFLDDDCCCIFFVSKLFSFIHHWVVGVDYVTVSRLTLFKIECHDYFVLKYFYYLN